jgi:2-hydroxychromene-2-carboxylate isomerase
MSDPSTPRPLPKALLAERIAGHRDPLSVLRARRFGADLVSRRPPVLELYYEPGDPHSHLCAQLLPGLLERVRAPIEVRLVGQGGPEDYPEAERQRAYAIKDATRIAPAHGLTFPADAQIPDAAEQRWAAGELSYAADVRAFTRLEPEIAATLFAAGASGARRASGAANAALDVALTANASRRRQLGHNLPGVWQFDGDWFWGVDRVHHLESRLRRHRLLDGDEPLDQLRPLAAELPSFDAELPSLEFFYSFRSPYSYLAAVKMKRFHSSWPSGVEVRPVLPMAMRNITVPRVKRMYTVRDVKREAGRLGVPFGRIADPLGDGARRCLQVFPLADGTEAQLELLLSAARAVWAEGFDVATDAGLRFVVERAGIGWDAASERIAAGSGDDNDGEMAYAERNRADLLDAGLWGVPCYRIGELTAWGQDRFWMLHEIARRHAAGPTKAGSPARS